ncbi:MAG: peptidoglycan D,D-transpeptidase FtsI family protein [Candidatus Marinamargulisbacteria bacterium]
MTLFHRRYFIIIFCVIVVFLAIFGRLIYLMVIQHDFYLGRSEKQIQKLIRVDTSRGKILDRNNHPLATSLPVHSVYASPIKIKNKSQFSNMVAPYLGMPAATIFEKINNESTFVWLKRKALGINIDQLKKIAPNQMNVLQEERRVYPNNQLMSDVLGFVGMDKGLGGLEYQFDRFLTGEQGYYIIKGDPRGVRMISSNKVLVGRAKGFSQGYSGIEASSLKGGNIITTIDYRIQFWVEQHLKETIERVKAQAGQVIVMDVKNGDILAMANYPFFDPNHYESATYSILKNSCIVDVFEPGSIFKLITYAAALEEKVVTPGMLVTIPESVVIQKQRIKEAHDRLPGDPSMYPAKDILVKSMNVGTTILAEKMGKDAFYDYIQAFGFGERAFILLPGETNGLLRPLETMAPIDLAVMSFGQGISVTSLQMVAAVASIGNDGMYVRPRIIKHQTDHDQLTISNPAPFRQRRIISSETARHVQAAMAEVVTRGTGQYAAVKGYRVGGKTGTAQRPLEDGRGYEEGAYIASFVGLLPIQRPQYAILVVVDRPETTIWGSTAAAPLFSDIAKIMIDYVDIQPAKN